jgi:uncharacterized membrane protein
MSNFPWRTLLFVSLVVNLLLIGGVIGVVASGARLHGPPFERHGVRGPIAAVAIERRRALMGGLREAWRQSDSLREASRQARLDLFAAAEKEPYDEAAVRAALAKMRAADVVLAEKYHDAVATALAKLPPEERMAALRATTRPGGLRRAGQPPP